MTRRTTVLLGAGASVDARLPISSRLTEALSREIDRRSPGKQAQAFHMVIGAIIAHDAKRGVSPYDGVDVERAFSAIKMLSERDQLEVAPFVGNWTDTPLRVGGDLPVGWGRSFSNAFGSIAGESQIEAQFKSGVLAITNRSPGSDTYQRLTHSTLKALVRILTINEPARFDHLLPIFDFDQVRVATLNYDLGVELAAGQAGVPLDRGIESWNGGFHWAWSGEGIGLLKLHGSIDWTLEEMQQEPTDEYFSPGRQRVSVIAGESARWDQEPAIIFGAREKLRAEGPFLAMLHEFDSWLRTTDDLVIVGYSFRDEHINVALRDWLRHMRGRTLSIVDPAFPVGDGRMQSGAPFAKWLVYGMHPLGPPRQRLNGETFAEPELAAPFKIYREAASTALPKVLSSFAGND